MNDQTTKKTSSLSVSKQQKLSDTSSSSPVIVPTPSVTSEPDDLALREKSRMDASQDQVENQVAQEGQKLEDQEQPVPPPPADDAKVDVTADLKKARGDKKVKRSVKKSKHVVIESSSSESSEDSDSESESSSEDEKSKRRRKQKTAAKRVAAKKKQKAKAKAKKSKSKKFESSSDDASSSGSESESDVEVAKLDKKSRRKALKTKAKKKKSKKAEIASEDDSNSPSSSSDSSSSESESEDEPLKRRRAKAKRKSKKSKTAELSSSEESSADDDVPVPPPALPIDAPVLSNDINSQVAQMETLLVGLKAQQAATPAVVKLDKPVKKNILEFKRVDQVFDMKIRDWKLVESNKDTKDEFDCVFTVRRRLNWEGKYQETQIDIKSKVLRNCLQEVFKECKSISLVEETPQLDPHTLFHYYDELKAHVKNELKPKLKRAKKSKDKKLRTQQIAQCKLLLKYLDEDYTSVRKALKPMLKAGTITYDLVWALFKPNTIAFTPTYANKDDPRCFRVDFSYEYESWLTQAKSLVVDGRYLEYDGKHFGLGDHQVQIQAFKGHKKITSLSAYPLKYHKDPEVSNFQVEHL